jgi:hypothetical protein
MKALTQTDITPHARHAKSKSDVIKRVQDLDSAYPAGSACETVHKSYGEDGKYLVSNLPYSPALVIVATVNYACRIKSNPNAWSESAW